MLIRANANLEINYEVCKKREKRIVCKTFSKLPLQIKIFGKREASPFKIRRVVSDIRRVKIDCMTGYLLCFAFSRKVITFHKMNYFYRVGHQETYLNLGGKKAFHFI